MCVPVMAAVAIASTVASIGGQIVKGSAEAQQAKMEGGIARQNAALSNAQAKDSLANTQIEAKRRYQEGAQLEGQQQAAMAANGIDLGFGSALQVQRDTKMITGEDVGQIYKAGYQKARGYEINAFNYSSQAAAAQSKASAAGLGTVFGVASTALGGASQVYGMMSKPH